MKNKRGTDHWWRLFQYRDSETIFAKCKCGFIYPSCESTGEPQEQRFVKLYNYCPRCGAKKKYYDDEIRVVDFSVDDRRP